MSLSLPNLSLIITSLGAIVYTADWIMGRKMKPGYRVLLVVVSLFSLLYFAIDFTKDKNEAATTQGNKVPMPTEPILRTDSTDQKPGAGKVEVPVTTNVPPINPEGSPVLINTAEKTKLAVMALVNGKRDNQLALVFSKWLKKYGSVSITALQNSFIETGLFAQISGGNTSALKDTQINETISYICLVSSSLLYENSAFDAGLVKAVCVYDILIAETKSGKVIDVLQYRESASGISSSDARQRCESFLAAFLQSLSLQL